MQNIAAENLIELDKIEKERQRALDESFEIPFWLIFRIVDIIDEVT